MSKFALTEEGERLYISPIFKISTKIEKCSAFNDSESIKYTFIATQISRPPEVSGFTLDIGIKKVWELLFALSYIQVFALPLEWIKQQPTPI